MSNYDKMLQAIKEETDDSLTTSLLTVDGLGARYKEACLKELLKRETDKKYAKALELIREATSHAIKNEGLVEAVAVLISQRDNARHYSDIFREKLKQLGHEYV